jgi:hypothetical protein
VTVSDREQVRALVAEAVGQGARQHAACEMVGVAARTLQRWQHPETAEDGRRGPHTTPRHTLSPGERAQMVAMAARQEFCNVSPHQIVPRLADRGEYLASESSFYRVLKMEQLLAHRGRATPAHLRGHGTVSALQLGHHLRTESDSGTVFLFVFVLGCLLAQDRGRGGPHRGIHGALLAAPREDLPCGGHRAASGVGACGQRGGDERLDHAGDHAAAGRHALVQSPVSQQRQSVF